jgi:trimeric autotransporter adhesin
VPLKKFLPLSRDYAARAARFIALVPLFLVVAACGGSGGGSTPTYTVGGSISGLTGHGLVLGNNGADPLTVSADGSFTFRSGLGNGSIYKVEVVTQPTSPTQTCSVANASGVISAANVTTVQVTCTTNTFTVGGTVAGLSGSSLTLSDNGSDQLSVSANGSFTFQTAVPDGTPYSVAVRTQPTAPTQTCAVANANGTISGGNVSTVQVTCSTKAYSVGVAVSGLAGSGFALSLNGGTSPPISGNGSVTFPGMLSSGTAFAVTASTEPAGPTQICSVTSGSGVIASASVTVTVSCTSISGFAYIIGSPAPGLAGYSIASQTGELTSLSGSPFTNPSSTLPSDVAAAPTVSTSTWRLTGRSTPTQSPSRRRHRWGC